MKNTTKIEGIRLFLTLEQAFYLHQVLRNVGGPPEGPRGLVDEVCQDLKRFEGDFETLDIPDFEMRGSVVLRNVEKED